MRDILHYPTQGTYRGRFFVFVRENKPPSGGFVGVALTFTSGRSRRENKTHYTVNFPAEGRQPVDFICKTGITHPLQRPAINRRAIPTKSFGLTACGGFLL